jgi:diguanylate cyclase (GGDEF)-like protein
MYAFGALVGTLTQVFARSADRDEQALILLTIITVGFSATFFVGYRRLPLWFFHAALASGTAMIAGATIVGSPGAEGVNALWCAWVVVLAFLFFGTRGAIAQTAFVIVAYGFALVETDASFAANYVVVLAVVLGTSGGVIGLLRSQLEQVAANLASEANTDLVTAISNRRGFNDRFEMELDRAQRTGGPLSLVICDLDRFKAVNDELGHQEGDLALRRAAAALCASVRSIDLVARLGGEEFAVLLPDANRMEAYVVAERVRHGILEAFIDHEVPITGSCGVATYDDHAERRPDALMRAADAALYQAKAMGRNCTVSAEEKQPA